MLLYSKDLMWCGQKWCQYNHKSQSSIKKNSWLIERERETYWTQFFCNLIVWDFVLIMEELCWRWEFKKNSYLVDSSTVKFLKNSKTSFTTYQESNSLSGMFEFIPGWASILSKTSGQKVRDIKDNKRRKKTVLWGNNTSSFVSKHQTSNFSKPDFTYSPLMNEQLSGLVITLWTKLEEVY